jgi:hypothetical protein
MPFMSQSSVTIYFSDAALTSQPPPPGQGLGLDIRVVESVNDQHRVWTLTAPGQPDYQLTPEETDRLLELCSRISLSAPWRGQMGFDGATSTLALKSAMSEMAFSWWGDTPAEWQSVGALFDCVMSIANNLQ